MPRRSNKSVLQIAQAKLAVVPTEDGEQAMLFSWAELAQGVHPELGLLFAVPNETGWLHPKTRGRLARMGRKSGVPDIMLPVPKRGKHGLFIELKRQNGVPSDVSAKQAMWLDALDEQGYTTAVCYGFAHARMIIEEYLA